MEGEITFQELVDWLVKTSDGARTFYNENKEIVKKYELKSGEYWYLKHLGWFLRLIAFLKISKIPYFDFWYPFIKPFVFKGKQLFIDYMGDVAIYATTDVKSKHFNIRKSILDESVKEVKSLIDDPRYEKIIIVGHSLGSVIAFDTLNRITHAANIDREKWRSVGKIEGLITFGSPLDKIAFFFREHTPKGQYIRRQILAHFHCFKNRDLNLQKDEIEVDNPIAPLLDDVKWINFWDKKDPVSGHLDFYIVDENIELHMKDEKSGKDVKFGLAHTKCWEWKEMYTKMCDYFLK